jgi:uncharacterized membrane protein YuzA (DUF378 family)
MADHFVNLVLLSLVFVGALNWGLAAFNLNAVKTVDNGVNKLLGTNLPVEKAVYLLVAAAGVNLYTTRNVWLVHH